MDNIVKTAAKVQKFAPEGEIVIGSRRFTVDTVDADSAHPAHILRGMRGANYYLQPFMQKDNPWDHSLFYITSVTGDGAPLRDKSGQQLRAYIFANLLTDATSK